MQNTALKVSANYLKCKIRTALLLIPLLNNTNCSCNSRHNNNDEIHKG